MIENIDTDTSSNSRQKTKVTVVTVTKSEGEGTGKDLVCLCFPRYPPALVLICLLLPFTLLNLYKLGEKSINVKCKKNHCMQLLNDVTEIV